jgi:hypothetical protein
MNDRQQPVPVRKLRAKARAVAGSHEFGVSSNNNEQVGLRVEVIGGEFDGQSFVWFGTFSQAAEERTIEQLQIAGWTGEDIINLPGVGTTEFEVQLEEYEDYNEQNAPYTYVKAKWLNRISVGMKNAMDASQKADFARRMAMRMGKPAPQQTRSNGQRSTSRGGYREDTPDYTDDDIPL